MNARPTFSFEQPFVTRQAFTHGGKAYADGVPFPVADLKLTQQQIWNLWSASLIDNLPPQQPKQKQSPRGR